MGKYDFERMFEMTTLKSAANQRIDKPTTCSIVSTDNVTLLTCTDEKE